jgi:hypothetical protein
MPMAVGELWSRIAARNVRSHAGSEWFCARREAALRAVRERQERVALRTVAAGTSLTLARPKVSLKAPLIVDAFAG